jgi:hypothetical protein
MNMALYIPPKRVGTLLNYAVLQPPKKRTLYNHCNENLKSKKVHFILLVFCLPNLIFDAGNGSSMEVPQKCL